MFQPHFTRHIIPHLIQIKKYLILHAFHKTIVNWNNIKLNLLLDSLDKIYLYT